MTRKVRAVKMDEEVMPEDCVKERCGHRICLRCIRCEKLCECGKKAMIDHDSEDAVDDDEI